MQAKGISLEEREYGKKPLSERELREIIGAGPIDRFLNSRTSLYRERKMKINPPTADEAIRLMIKDQNLLRRPILVKGEKRVTGFNEAELENLL